MFGTEEGDVYLSRISLTPGGKPFWSLALTQLRIQEWGTGVALCDCGPVHAVICSPGGSLLALFCGGDGVVLVAAAEVMASVSGASNGRDKGDSSVSGVYTGGSTPSDSDPALRSDRQFAAHADVSGKFFRLQRPLTSKEQRRERDTTAGSVVPLDGQASPEENSPERSTTSVEIIGCRYCLRSACHTWLGEDTLLIGCTDGSVLHLVVSAMVFTAVIKEDASVTQLAIDGEGRALLVSTVERTGVVSLAAVEGAVARARSQHVRHRRAEEDSEVVATQPSSPLVCDAWVKLQQVGTKARAMGDFGACFAAPLRQAPHLPVSPASAEGDGVGGGGEVARLYAARHARRLFEADSVSGVVYRTFKFPDAPFELGLLVNVTARCNGLLPASMGPPAVASSSTTSSLSSTGCGRVAVTLDSSVREESAERCSGVEGSLSARVGSNASLLDRQMARGSAAFLRSEAAGARSPHASANTSSPPPQTLVPLEEYVIAVGPDCVALLNMGRASFVGAFSVPSSNIVLDWCLFENHIMFLLSDSSAVTVQLGPLVTPQARPLPMLTPPSAIGNADDAVARTALSGPALDASQVPSLSLKRSPTSMGSDVLGNSASETTALAMMSARTSCPTSERRSDDAGRATEKDRRPSHRSASSRRRRAGGVDRDTVGGTSRDASHVNAIAALHSRIFVQSTGTPGVDPQQTDTRAVLASENPEVRGANETPPASVAVAPAVATPPANPARPQPVAPPRNQLFDEFEAATAQLSRTARLCSLDRKTHPALFVEVISWLATARSTLNANDVALATESGSFSTLCTRSLGDASENDGNRDDDDNDAGGPRRATPQTRDDRDGPMFAGDGRATLLLNISTILGAASEWLATIAVPASASPEAIGDSVFHLIERVPFSDEDCSDLCEKVCMALSSSSLFQRQVCRLAGFCSAFRCAEEMSANGRHGALSLPRAGSRADPQALTAAAVVLVESPGRLLMTEATADSVVENSGVMRAVFSGRCFPPLRSSLCVEPRLDASDEDHGTKPTDGSAASAAASGSRARTGSAARTGETHPGMQLKDLPRRAVGLTPDEIDALLVMRRTREWRASGGVVPITAAMGLAMDGAVRGGSGPSLRGPIEQLLVRLDGRVVDAISFGPHAVTSAIHYFPYVFAAVPYKAMQLALHAFPHVGPAHIDWALAPEVHAAAVGVLRLHGADLQPLLVEDLADFACDAVAQLVHRHREGLLANGAAVERCLHMLLRRHQQLLRMARNVVTTRKLSQIDKIALDLLRTAQRTVNVALAFPSLATLFATYDYPRGIVELRLVDSYIRRLIEEKRIDALASLFALPEVMDDSRWTSFILAAHAEGQLQAATRLALAVLPTPRVLHFHLKRAFPFIAGGGQGAAVAQDPQLKGVLDKLGPMF